MGATRPAPPGDDTSPRRPSGRKGSSRRIPRSRHGPGRCPLDGELVHEPGERLCSWTAPCSRAPAGVSPGHSSLEHTAPSLVSRPWKPATSHRRMHSFLSFFFKTSKSSPNGSSPHQSPVVPEGTGTCFLNAQAAGRAGPLSGRTAGLGGGERAVPVGPEQRSADSGSRSVRGERESRPGESADSGDLGCVLLPCGAAAAAATSGSEEEKRLPRWSLRPSVTSAGTGPRCAARGPSLRAPST